MPYDLFTESRKDCEMDVIELTPIVTHDADGLEVTEFLDWFYSDDLGYFAEYAENM